MNLFKLASKAIYANIAASKLMIDSFNNAYDNILPTITKFPKAFIPAFVGVASHNEEFCDNLLKKRLTSVIQSSPKLNQNQVGQNDFDTLMELISGLLLIKS